jgi:hypothetical protein
MQKEVEVGKVTAEDARPGLKEKKKATQEVYYSVYFRAKWVPPTPPGGIGPA